MSTQLIVYPQNYQGVYNASYSYYYAEFITNGQIFSGFDSTGVQDVSTPGQASVLAIQQQYAASYVTLNAWYRWHTSGVLGTTTEPVLSGTNILFPATPSGASLFYKRQSIKFRAEIQWVEEFLLITGRVFPFLLRLRILCTYWL